MLKAVVFLEILAAAAASAQPFVICSGLAEIPGTYNFSFDRGVIVHPDIYWRQMKGRSNRTAVRYIGGNPRSGMVNLGIVDPQITNWWLAMCSRCTARGIGSSVQHRTYSGVGYLRSHKAYEPTPPSA